MTTFENGDRYLYVCQWYGLKHHKASDGEKCIAYVSDQNIIPFKFEDEVMPNMHHVILNIMTWNLKVLNIYTSMKIEQHFSQKSNGNRYSSRSYDAGKI